MPSGSASRTSSPFVWLRRSTIQATAVNCITGGAPEYGQIPLSFDRDRDALQAAYDTTGVIDPKDLRLVWIKNTLELEYLWASEAMMPEVEANPNLEIVAPSQDIPFDAQGNMVMEWPKRWADKEAHPHDPLRDVRETLLCSARFRVGGAYQPSPYRLP